MVQCPSWGTSFIDLCLQASPVWEITGAEYSTSHHHTAGGISIRFPRVTRVRDDKDWQTATNLDRLKVQWVEFMLNFWLMSKIFHWWPYFIIWYYNAWCTIVLESNRHFTFTFGFIFSLSRNSWMYPARRQVRYSEQPAQCFCFDERGKSPFPRYLHRFPWFPLQWRSLSFKYVDLYEWCLYSVLSLLVHRHGFG